MDMNFIHLSDTPSFCYTDCASIFSSPYNWLRKRAEKELYSQESKANNEIIIREGDSFIVIKSGFPLEADEIERLADLL